MLRVPLSTFYALLNVPGLGIRVYFLPVVHDDACSRSSVVFDPVIMVDLFNRYVPFRTAYGVAR
jgi:hypothetical protein